MLQPFRALRSVRVLRVLRALRIIAYLVWILQTANRLWSDMGGKSVLMLAPALTVVGASVVWLMEHDTNPQIVTFGDALWWAMATVTAVGYGDIAPVTAAGRAVAAILMVSGISAFSVVTANVAASITHGRAGPPIGESTESVQPPQTGQRFDDVPGGR